MITRLALFLTLNFGALYIGSYFTDASSSTWYENLNKAPWTPAGWVFGAAWTTIMICFSIYLAYLWPVVKNKSLLLFLFSIQWMLNVGWNPIFFYYNNILTGMLIITFLTMLVGFFLYHYWSDLKVKAVLILPYFIWLLIATSLNAYILFHN